MITAILQYLLHPVVVCEAGESSVCDDHLLLLNKDVLGVQVLGHNSSSMKVTHGLGHLVGQVEGSVNGELLTPKVDLLVQCVTLAEAVSGRGLVV